MTAVERDCRRAIVVGLAVVAVASILVAALGATPWRAVAFGALAAASWFIASVTLWQARTLASSIPAARLGAATHLTLARGLLVSVTAGFAVLPPTGVVQWIPALLYATAALADRWDGAIARRLGQVTAMGAHLDGAMDALGLLAAPLVAVAWGRLPPWYLGLGATYYLYQGAIAARRRLGLPLFPERVVRRPVTRLFAGLQMTLVAAALPPVLPFTLTASMATLLMLPTLAFFARDWLLLTGRRSRVPASTLPRARAPVDPSPRMNARPEPRPDARR
ncbi:MAG: CDP-alcohol phosphatidyltransferase family protein [Myxococcales bacterium]